MGDLTDARKRHRVAEISARMREKASEETVPQGHTQLRQVASDLCGSVCKAAAERNDPQLFTDGLSDEFVEEHSERVREILSAIPSAFHHWSFKTRDGRSIEPFQMNVPEMMEAAKDVVELKPEDVAKAYGQVWTHVRALSELRPDAKSTLKMKSCLHASKDGVEYVADRYLAADDFVSPLLEWAIVDALVLDRITSFAEVCSATGNLPDTPQGQLLEGPLLPGTGAFPMGIRMPGWSYIIGKSVSEVAAKLAVEAILLAATWWLSELLAGSEGLPKWILFTGVTAARWVSTAINSNADYARESEAKGKTNLQMLWDMGIAHERIPSMNVGLLRHLFYRLEERGAAFSPAIYAVLDKRARREAVQ